MKIRNLIGPFLTAAALMFAGLPASAATLGVVNTFTGGPLVPGGPPQVITWTCPSVTASGGNVTVTANGTALATSGQGCDAYGSGSGDIQLPDTFANSATVSLVVTQSGVEVATGTIPTAPSTLSFQPSPSQGKTGDTIQVSGSGISAHDGQANVKINGVPATVELWDAGTYYTTDHLNIEVPQCVPLGAGTIVVTNANGTSSTEPFTVTSATCNGKVEGSGTGGSGSGSGGSGTGSGSGSGGSNTGGTTPPPTTGTGRTGTSNTGTGGTGTSKTGTTSSSKPASSYSISGPPSLSVGGGAAYSLLPSPSTGTVSWFSSNPSVATVSPAGDVTAHNAGTVTISASAGGKSAAKIISVTPVSSPNGTGKSTGGSGGGAGGGSTHPTHEGGMPGWIWCLLLVILLIILGVILRRPLRKLRVRLNKRVRDGLADVHDKGTPQQDGAPKNGGK